MLRSKSGFAFAVASLVSLTAVLAPAQDSAPTELLPDQYLPELKTLLSKAVNQSPQTLTASIEVARSRAQEMVDSSAMWPTLSANLNWAGVQSSISGTTTVTSRNSGFFYTLSLYQPVYHWGALKAQADIAKLQTASAQDRYVEAYRTLALSVRNSYLELIKTKKAWNYAKANLDQEQSRFEALQQRFKAGAISAAELSEPQLRLAEARIAADRLEETFNASARTLAGLCGVESISAESVPDDFPKPVASETQLGTLYRLADSFNPASTPMGRYNQSNIDQAKLNYKIAKTRLLPKIGLRADANEQNSTTALGGSLSQQNVSQQTVGIWANWTIFDGFAARGQKRVYLQQQRQYELAMSEYDRTTRQKIESLKKQIVFAVRSLEVSETRLSIANNAVAVIAAEVKSGHSSPDGLVTVQASARAAELNTLTYRTDLFARVAEYLSTIGADPVLTSVAQNNQKNVE